MSASVFASLILLQFMCLLLLPSFANISLQHLQLFNMDSHQQQFQPLTGIALSVPLVLRAPAP